MKKPYSQGLVINKKHLTHLFIVIKIYSILFIEKIMKHEYDDAGNILWEAQLLEVNATATLEEDAKIEESLEILKEFLAESLKGKYDESKKDWIETQIVKCFNEISTRIIKKLVIRGQIKREIFDHAVEAIVCCRVNIADLLEEIRTQKSFLKFNKPLNKDPFDFEGIRYRIIKTLFLNGEDTTYDLVEGRDSDKKKVWRISQRIYNPDTEVDVEM